jgi:hypothetical protein
MVLPLDDSTNEQDDDNGEAGKADGAGGDNERCGRCYASLSVVRLGRG